MCQGSWLRNQQYQRSKKKEHEEEAKADVETAAVAKENEEVKDTVVTHVNNISHSIFSNIEVYINNQQVYNSNGLYVQKSYISNNFKRAFYGYKETLHCGWYISDELPDEGKVSPLSEPFLTSRMKMLSKPDGFMLYGKLAVDFFATFELLYPNMKTRLRLFRARLCFYMISDNPNVSLGSVDCSFCTRRFILKNDYHKKRMDTLAYTLVEINYLETQAKIFNFSPRRNQFIQENIIDNAPCSSPSNCF